MLNLPKDTATPEAFTGPQPGDRFTEMYAFWMYVLDVQPDGGPVTVAEFNAPCTAPRDGKLRTFRCVHDFRDAYAYESIPGYWVWLVDRGNNVTGWLRLLRDLEEERRARRYLREQDAKL